MHGVIAIARTGQRAANLRAAGRRMVLLLQLLLAGLPALAAQRAAADPPGPAEAPRLGPVRRLPCPFQPEALRFSPDGERLLASGPKLKGFSVIDLAGDTVRQLSEEPGAGVGMTWSPDGREVLYRTRHEERGEDLLRSVAADGSATARTLAVAPALGFPALLPDGRVVLTLGNALVALPRAAADPLRFTGPPPVVGSLGGVGDGALAPEPGGPAAPGGAGVQQLLGHVQGLRVAIAGDGNPPVAFVDHGRFILRAPLVADWMPGRRVAFSGEGFFLGDPSPDGRRVIVHESRGAQGYFHVAEAGGPLATARRELGSGHGAAWAGPELVVFEVLEHDTWRVTASDLWAVAVQRGERWPLLTGPEGIEMLPAADPAGRLLAWVDHRDRGLYLAALLPGSGQRGEGGR